MDKKEEFKWDIHEIVGKLKVKYRRFLGLDCFFRVVLYYKGRKIANNITLKEIGFDPEKEKLDILFIREGELYCIDN